MIVESQRFFNDYAHLNTELGKLTINVREKSHVTGGNRECHLVPVGRQLDIVHLVDATIATILSHLQKVSAVRELRWNSVQHVSIKHFTSLSNEQHDDDTSCCHVQHVHATIHIGISRCGKTKRDTPAAVKDVPE